MVNNVDNDSILLICSNLKTYISAGIPMYKALELVEFSVNNKIYKESLGRILAKVSVGKTLSESIKGEGKLYPNIFGDMISIGEESGKLENVLERLGEHLKQKSDITKKIKKLFVYPAFLLLTAIGVIIFYLLFILPSFKTLYEDMEENSSTIISLIMKYLSFIEGNKYAFFIIFCYAMILIVTIILFVDYGRTREFFNNITLIKMYYEINLIFILKLIVSSGIPINNCLEKLSSSLESERLRVIIISLKENLWMGKGLSESLGLLNIISPITLSLVFSGEEAGKLESNIDTVSEILEKNFMDKINWSVSILEPMIIGVLGLIVVFMVVLVFAPIYGYISYV